MYITTFYSFKGGVGRTMSLVNIGLELVRAGRRVLLVDFDLEAPGIETFNLAKPKKCSLGIVDYVTHYRETNRSPDVRDYLYESQGVDDSDGKLWIMPSGMHDENYAKCLNQIKWDDVYKYEDGYLMIEDMKAQWKESLNPDYVLIDSRTGHTDVGGICTRQLPDAVVILFFPNEQNLLGLERVVPTIRDESNIRERKPIQLHFVSSNVPNLDDENQILEKRLTGFQHSLGYRKLACTIHHYNHLSLLDQEIFTYTHPRSQLAKEYRELYSEIIKHNPEDREGALNFLNEIITRPRIMLSGLPATELENRLQRICLEHSADGEVLAKAAMYRYRNGKERDALELLNQAIHEGYENPELLLMRASLGYSLKHSNAVDDIKNILSSDNAEYFDVSRAVELLKKISPSDAVLIPDSHAFKILDQDSRFEIARDMSDDECFLPIAKKIIKDILCEKGTNENLAASLNWQLGMIEIAMGEYSVAMSLIIPDRDKLAEHDIANVFNYAMAEWGQSGNPPHDLFEKVVTMAEVDDDVSRLGPNYLQCMAISYWASGDPENSLKMLDKSEQQIKSRPKAEFSAWRYLTVNMSDFLSDLQDIRKMLDGEDITPLFMQKNLSLLEDDM